MQTQCAHYSLYQRFFNRCLREWYVQREGGSGFHYADPPGILFTRMRTPKSQNRVNEAPMNHWYFNTPARKAPITQNANLRSVVYGASDGHVSRPVESFLHMGYDIWYTRVLGTNVERFKDVYHVSFCNSYDVAFNTLFNIGRRLNLNPDDFKTFGNFRLVTGNIFNMKNLLNEQCFKCVVVSVTNKNFNYMMHTGTLHVLSNVMTENGLLMAITREREVLRKIKKAFETEKVSKLYTHLSVVPQLTDGTMSNVDSDGLPYDSQLGDKEVRGFISTFVESDTSENSNEILSKKCFIAMYRKKASTLPNQMLRKPVDTK